jgi:uncharacterized protein (TIGR03000 family)
MEMTTNVNVRVWRIVCYLCAFLTSLSTNQSASAQCCGGSAMGEYSSELMSPGMIIEGDSIYLTVILPEAAVLKVNDDPTISLGATRYFVVRGLDPAKIYTFDIVAEALNPAGVALVEKKTLKLKPGANDIVTLKPVKRKVPRPKTDVSKADDEKDASAEDKKSKAEDSVEKDADTKEKGKSTQTNRVNNFSKKIRQV